MREITGWEEGEHVLTDSQQCQVMDAVIDAMGWCPKSIAVVEEVVNDGPPNARLMITMPLWRYPWWRRAEARAQEAVTKVLPERADLRVLPVWKLRA